ncbi:MAG: RIP metalloprotease RseP [Thermodesulfovibrionales bacterium]|nr:RIP metalloprotease RseP [Thermodesulfovibrionales bacterium]
MTILSAVLLFGFIIFIHELGHFIVAKYFNVKVLKFSIGFGPRVIGRKIGETEYMISAVPLGGYVKMLGEDVEDKEDLTPQEIDEIKSDPRSFRNQPVSKRIAIVFAGPLFNLLTAVAIFFGIYVYGVPTLKPVIGEVIQGSPADKAGLKPNDEIVMMDGKKIRQWTEMTEIIHKSANKPLKIEYVRDAKVYAITIVPEEKVTKDIFGEDKKVGLIGIKPADKTFVFREDPLTAFDKAILKTGEIIYLTFVGIIKIIQKIIPADNIGGPILIFQMAEKTASLGLISFLTFTAIISINLGVLNLLPIPILDGGHILFFLIEGLIKRPINEKVIIISQRIGLALIIALMAFAIYNDIFRLFGNNPTP